MQYITDQQTFHQVLPEILAADTLALDTETRSLDPYTADLLLVQLCDSSETIWVFDARKLDLQELFTQLTAANPLIIGHNLKYDLAVLGRHFKYVPKRIYDTMLAYGIINNGLDSPYISYKQLVMQHCDVILNKDIRKTFETTYAEITQDQLEYSANDVLYLHKICQDQVKRLEKDGLLATAKLEFSLIPVIIQMESTGILLDKEAWLDVAAKRLAEAEALELELGKQLGAASQLSFMGPGKSYFNPRSPKQVKAALKQFGYDVESTAVSTISSIDHPFVTMLLQYREAYKLATTYGTNFLKFLHADGRIHAQFNQLGAESGRFSSSKPNLQNIPHTQVYRDCFVCSPDNILITCDFSQIELRVAAVLSGEQLMIDEYAKARSDLHRLTAAHVYDVAVDAVTDEQRYMGKTTNFSTIYGISKYSLATRLDCSVEHAKKLITGFQKTYKRLHTYMQQQANLGLQQGYTTTKLGRRRYYKLPALGDTNYTKKLARIRRVASNSVIQGTAADILKLAMVKLYTRLQPYSAKLVNIVHDEVVVECPQRFTGFCIGVVSDCMAEAATELLGDSIRWDVSLSVGKTWKK